MLKKEIKEQTKIINIYKGIFKTWYNRKLINILNIEDDEEIYKMYKNIYDNHDKITEYITGHYKNHGSYSQHMKTLAVVYRELKNKYGDEIYTKKHKNMLSIVKENINKIIDIKGENNDKYIEWEKILNIITIIKEKCDKTENYKMHILYLLFMMISKLAPNRSQIYPSIIIKKK